MKALRWTGGALLWVVAVLGALSGALFLGPSRGLGATARRRLGVDAAGDPQGRPADRGAGRCDGRRRRRGHHAAERSPEPSSPTGSPPSPATDADYLIEMAGDANKASDPKPYRVDAGATVLQPMLTIPAVGNVVLLLARPAVAIPLAVAVLALIGLSLVPASAARDASRDGRGFRMNGYRRYGVSALSALAAASLALGVGLALAPFGPARAAPTPEFTLEFPGLVPGVPQTDSATYTLERDADLVSFAWLERSGVLANDNGRDRHRGVRLGGPLRGSHHPRRPGSLRSGCRAPSR